MSTPTPPYDPDATVVLPPVLAPTEQLGQVSASEARRWRRRALAAAGAAAGLLLLGGAALALGLSARDRAAALEQELASERQVVVSQQQELTAALDDLVAAEQRVLELARSSGQSAVEQAQAELETATQTALLGGSVGNALEACVDGQRTLIGYLKNPGGRSASQIASYEDTVEELCSAAISAQRNLQQLLAE
jgi:hypothetical protein